MYISMEEVHDYKHWMKLATVSYNFGVCVKFLSFITVQSDFVSHYSVFIYGTLMPGDSTKLVQLVF